MKEELIRKHIQKLLDKDVDILDINAVCRKIEEEETEKELDGYAFYF